MKVEIFLTILFSIDVYGAVSTIIPNNLFFDEADFFEIAKHVTPCYEDDPHLNECVKQAALDMKPDLLNILPADPRIISHHDANFSIGAIHGGLKLNNMKIYGKRDFDIRDIRLQIKDKIIELDIDLFFPRIAIEAGFTVNSTEGEKKGYINETMTAVDTKYHWIGHLITVNNRKFLQIDTLQTTSDMDDMKIHISGLGKTPEEDKRIEAIINSRWHKIEDMYSHLGQLQSRMESISKANINGILKIIPYDSIIKGKAGYYNYTTLQMPLNGISSANLIKFSWLLIFISLLKSIQVCI